MDDVKKYKRSYFYSRIFIILGTYFFFEFVYLMDGEPFVISNIIWLFSDLFGEESYIVSELLMSLVISLPILCIAVGLIFINLYRNIELRIGRDNLQLIKIRKYVNKLLLVSPLVFVLVALIYNVFSEITR